MLCYFLMIKDFLAYSLIRAFTAPIALLPYSAVQRIGEALGLLAYYLSPKFRKRTLSNLSLATALNLSPDELVSTAKRSMQNLMITCLEYAKLARENNIRAIATCENPQEAEALLQQGNPVIFFCAHQANWEVLFLEGTTRMPGVAIGRPIKNKYLYDWVIQMREKFGGTIITPKNAIREGMKALKKGRFLGIVGDQGMPDSGFSSPFLGRMAWTSPIPAILSYRTNHPIIVASTHRVNGHYKIHYSPPIWPNLNKPMEEEIPRIMGECLHYLETSIIAHPEQWLWQHNRWKQQTLDKIRRPFRQEALCIILPEDEKNYTKVCSALPAFRLIYPTELIALFVPKNRPLPQEALIEGVEVHYYSSTKDLLVRDYRFKLLFDFLGNHAVRKHFFSLSVSTIVDMPTLYELAKAKPEEDLTVVLQRAICHAG